MYHVHAPRDVLGPTFLSCEVRGGRSLRSVSHVLTFDDMYTASDSESETRPVRTCLQTMLACSIMGSQSCILVTLQKRGGIIIKGRISEEEPSQ
jgi:hypothetical protein